MIGSPVWHFLRLTRPLFLIGGITLYGLGSLIAVVETGVFYLPRFFAGQFLVTAIQLMTHYFNEYFDIEADRLNHARTWFSGGSGVLSNGILSPTVARWAGTFLALAAVVTIVIIGMQVPLVFLLGTLSLMAAWSYSGPPLTLASSGWGELSASLVVALMVPVVGYTIQTGGKIALLVLVTMAPLILIHFAMLIAFQIPDFPADQAAGKRTLSVRLGLRRAVQLHNVSLLAAFVMILGMALSGWPGASLALIALPLALWQFITIGSFLRDHSRSFLGLTMRAVGLFALTSLLWVAGYAILLPY